MLFNSPEFLFLFLPLVLVVFHIARRFLVSRIALLWLTTASLFFYGWWEPIYLVLLLGSVTVNYLVGQALAAPKARRPALLFAGIAFNLGPGIAVGRRMNMASSDSGVISKTPAGAVRNALRWVSATSPCQRWTGIAIRSQRSSTRRN